MILKKLTTNFRNELQETASSNDLVGYYSGILDFKNHPNASSGIIGFGRDIDISDLDKLGLHPSEKPAASGIVSADKRNCKLIWNTLGKLSPSEAADPGVWSYLSHFVCREYIVKRWPYDLKNSRENWLSEKFNPDTGQLLRYEGSLSKLWWAGYILNNQNSFSFDDALDIFYTTTDMHNIIFGSPILISFDEIFSGILRLFKRKIKALGGEKEFTTDKSNVLKKEIRNELKKNPNYKIKNGDYVLKYRRFFTVLNSSVNGYNIHLKNSNQLDTFLDDIYDNKI